MMGAGSTNKEALQQTSRPTVAALEAILGIPFPILDKGFVRVVDYMGNDDAIVQAARVSYGKGTKSISEDAALISYLMRHLHTTPFEMCEIKFHIKLPIFVARQWVRHRTANINEYSARYSVMQREFYVPALDDIGEQSSSNKQGRQKKATGSHAEIIRDVIAEDAERSFDTYEKLLTGTLTDSANSTTGISRELARIGLPLSAYTEWYWKIDLHNLFHFLRLRADEHAQLEIRRYADEMLRIVQKWVPIAHAAFLEHQFKSIRLSRTAVAVLSKMLRGEKVAQADSGLSKREWDELLRAFKM